MKRDSTSLAPAEAAAIVRDTSMLDLISGDHREGFRVVIADPPWSYNNSGCRGTAANEYSTMSVGAICDLPVGDLCESDATLFLWATWPNLVEALDVVKAWGFEYVTGLPWIKLREKPFGDLWGEVVAPPQYGVGFWVRGCTEPLLIARRGKVSPVTGDFVGLISENFGHSRKPDNVHQLAERLEGPYLELFARRHRAGWSVFGNEIGATTQHEHYA